MTDKGRPAEFDLDKKWDKVIDLSLRRIVYGSLAAGLTSLVLFSELFQQLFQLSQDTCGKGSPALLCNLALCLIFIWRKLLVKCGIEMSSQCQNPWGRFQLQHSVADKASRYISSVGGASVRMGITGIGAGFGAGSAYADSQREVILVA